MTVEDRVTALLGSDLRTKFLKSLGWNLGLSARFIFAHPGVDGMGRARACNEIMMAIWSQVESGGGPADGFPDESFISVLLSKADAGGVRINLREALERSFREFSDS
jgi:hypothetical protein